MLKTIKYEIEIAIGRDSLIKHNKEIERITVDQKLRAKEANRESQIDSGTSQRIELQKVINRTTATMISYFIIKYLISPSSIKQHIYHRIIQFNNFSQILYSYNYFFIKQQNLGMNLIGNNSNKTSLPQKNIKEKFLNEEIQSLRNIYQESQSFYDKINSILKKTILYNAQKHKSNQHCEIQAINNFIDDFSDLGESLLQIVNLSQSENQHFASTVMFKSYSKYNDALAFKKIMKSHQDFKQNLNSIILRLQKDIQKLQTNGYHIYNTITKPNNVLNSLKKTTLQKYIISLNEMNLIFSKIKNEMTNNIQLQKKSLNIFLNIDSQKNKDYYCKILQQILLKQKLINTMMIDQINNIKLNLKKYNRKIKDIEESIIINKKYNKMQMIEIKVLLNQYEDLNREQLKQYFGVMKEKTDKIMVVTCNLYDLKRKKSKSCHNILQTIKYNRPMKININQSQSASYQSSTHIIGSDILQTIRLN